MKYLKQLMIILIVSVIAELMSYFIPLPVPASMYGLVLMVILLLLKIVKLEQVEDTADFMLSIMPFFFVAPTVSLMTSFDAIKGNVILLVFMCFVSAVVVVAVTGLVAQAVIRFKNKKEAEKDA